MKNKFGKDAMILIFAFIIGSILFFGVQNFVNKNNKGDDVGLDHELEGNELIEKTSLYDVLKFENEIDPRDNKIVFSDLTYSHWLISSGERMVIKYDNGAMTSAGRSHKEHFPHNDKDLLTWIYNDEEEPPKNFYFELDEENLALNLWYAAGDKTDPAQQHPHVILKIVEINNDSIIFTSETFWFPNIQFIKDGTYNAEFVDFNLEANDKLKDRDEKVKSNYK